MEIFDPILTGSITIANPIQGGMTGSLQGTASVALQSYSSSYPFSVTGSSIYTTAFNPTTFFSTVQSVFIGQNAGASSSYAGNENSYVTAIGYGASSASYTNEGSVSVGHRAGALSDLVEAVSLGRDAGYSSSINQQGISIGVGAGSRSKMYYGISIGPDAGREVTKDPSYFSNVSYSTFIGYLSGWRAVQPGDFSIFLGAYTGRNSKRLESVTSIGYSAGAYAETSSYGIFLGSEAGSYSNITNESIFIGKNAGYSSTINYDSIFIGTNSGESTISASYSNAIGYASGYQISGSMHSVLIGTGVGRRISGVGIGSNNIIIGTNITLENSRKDSINLGGIIFATGSYAIGASDYFSQPAFSGSANGRVGINVVNPQYTLDVSGSGNYTNGLTVTGSTNLVNLTGSSALFTGAITAQTLVVQQVTSSIVYSSGSNRFGNQLTDVQEMTGSLRVTGSGDHYFLGGNLGLGVTPSAWTIKALQVENASLSNSGIGLYFSANSYFDGSWKYISSNPATQYYANANGGEHIWRTAPSGNAGAALAFTQSMTLDSSGNLGLGVTPSAWSGVTAFQLSIGSLIATSNIVALKHNTYFDGSADKYIGNGFSTDYYQSAGSHIWRTAPNNTSGAGAALAFTQSMTLDSSGNLGVRATSMSYPLTRNGITLKASGTDGAEFVILSSADTGFTGAALIRSGADFSVYNRTNGVLAFGTNDTERMRITSGGAISFKGTSTGANAMATFTNDNSDLNIYASDASGTNKNIRFYYAGTSGAEAMRITSGGDVGINTISPTAKLSVAGSGSFTAGVRIGTDSTNNLIDDASNGAGSTTLYIGNLSINAGPSDVRLKKNIVNTSIAGVDTINKLRVVDFNWQDPSDKSWNNRNARGTWTGLIAQETIKHVPYVVNAPRDRETMQPVEDSQEAYWQIEYQHLVPVLIKAVQELKAENEAFKVEINSLKAEITQLKSN